MFITDVHTSDIDTPTFRSYDKAVRYMKKATRKGEGTLIESVDGRIEREVIFFNGKITEVIR